MSERVTLSSGVVLECRPVNAFIIDAAMAKVKRPTVPTQYIESKGRVEDNPMHPDYLAAMEEYPKLRGEAAMNAFIVFGVKVISVPKDVPAVEDNGWSEGLEAVGLTIAPAGQARFRDWVQYVAIQSPDDYTLLADTIKRVSGTPEEEVTRAAESFPGGAKRRAHLGPPAKKAR